MALIDIKDDLTKDFDVEFTSSHKNRAFNLLKEDFPAYQGVFLDINKMIISNVSAKDIEKIIIDYYSDFGVNYKRADIVKNERKGGIILNLLFEEGEEKIEL